MSDPLVSVVTVCYNADRHLAEAMESVLAQRYTNIEYVVVDGGSTDGSVAIIAGFEERFAGRLTWSSEPDQGIYDAMNKGIARCHGQIVGLLNADDAYPPDAISIAVRALAEHPSAEAVFGDAEVIGEDGRVLRTEEAYTPQPGTIPPRMPMCHQSLFVAKRVYDRLGTYDTRYHILAYYEYVLRMLREGVEFVQVPHVLARFRLGGACSADMAASNAERERIRVAYGANPLVERLRRVRHAVNRFVYAVLTRRKTPAGPAEGRRQR